MTTSFAGTLFLVYMGGLPENTIEGINLSLAKGASAIEVDLQFTKDGEMVLLHDETVDRTSNGSGYISTKTLSEVKQLTIKNENNRFPYCKIPTLEELLDVVHEHKTMILLLEVKLSNPKYLKRMVNVIQKYPASLYDRIVVISFYPHLLHKIRLLDPDILVGLSLYGPMYSAESYTGSGDKYQLAMFERACFYLILKYVPKLIGTSLLILYKEDVFNNSVNIKQLQECGHHVILYEISSVAEMARCSQAYDNVPVIVSENLFLQAED